MSDSVVVIRLCLAAFLGGAIGYERERHGRAAGLRTHILVCVGSALIMLTAEHLFTVYQGRASIDPGRFAAQVVSGIGFLGAGTILQFRASVRGLTTAAGLWAAAGIGLAAGSGFYIGGLVATALVLGTLALLTQWEWEHLRKSQFKILTVHAGSHLEALKAIRATLMEYGAAIHDVEIHAQEGQTVLQLTVRLADTRQDDDLTRAITSVAGVSHVAWSSGP